MTIIMHGLFDLKDDVEEAAFRQAFELFAEHLKDNRMVISSRFMRHQAHDGYNAREPLTEYYVSIEFEDMGQAEACWAYVQANDEPLKSLHSAVFSKVCNSSFFLSSDTRSEFTG